MPGPLQLSQSALASFRRCQRRFYLRFVRRLEWPAPLTGSEQEWERSLQRGEELHLLIEQAALGMDAQGLVEATGDASLQSWWHRLQEHPPPQPHGRVYSELELSASLGGHRLLARFDRLVVGEQEGKPFIHIIDWKTGTPQPPQRLVESWQTAVYQFVAVQASPQLTPDNRQVLPAAVSFVYWQAEAPEAPVLVAYDEGAHAAGHERLQVVVQDIETRLESGEAGFARTADPEACRHCPYRSYCDRGREAPPDLHLDEDFEDGGLLPPAEITDVEGTP